jgi:hypothetical protein
MGYFQVFVIEILDISFVFWIILINLTYSNLDLRSLFLEFGRYFPNQTRHKASKSARRHADSESWLRKSCTIALDTSDNGGAGNAASLPRVCTKM